MQSIETSRSVSDLINDAIRGELAEDAKDLAIFDERANESTVGFEDFVKGLKRDGAIQSHLPKAFFLRICEEILRKMPDASWMSSRHWRMIHAHQARKNYQGKNGIASDKETIEFCTRLKMTNSSFVLSKSQTGETQDRGQSTTFD